MTNTAHMNEVLNAVFVTIFLNLIYEIIYTSNSLHRDAPQHFTE